jgi:hypothetical protein
LIVSVAQKNCHYHALFYDCARPAEAISAELSLSDAIQLFRALGNNPVIHPKGEYRGVSLPLGVTWLAGATVITKYIMGHGGHGAWVGKDIEGQQNLFSNTPESISYARPFTANKAHLSAFDGKPATLLDYSTTDSISFSIMRDEIRCFTPDHCIGFGGFTLMNGVKNGSPFLLFRTSESHAGHGEQQKATPSSEL